ncbi:MFS transporter [Sulfurivermis fontis]|uniref:MFS transporter n=1 Tax=Sulfurivermis fontis TaxID=1972068 RepID=UPI001E3D34FB|nr:MFS transporter [Sulfurivermis fontis]
MISISMTAKERHAAAALAGIFGVRMLGMFMILPVFALYAEHLADVTPLLIGVAIGIYGLTQALLQIPFGMASDRLGRKPVIVAGLLLFAAGSVVAALADSIHGVIIGRALQGAGAVAAAVMALVADLTREEHRTKAMAFIGMSIGLSFVVAMVLGPVLNQWFGVPGIFWLTAVLALGGIALLLLAVPNPPHTQRHRDAEPVAGQFGRILCDGQLLRLDFGILTLHMVLTASFVVVPLVLRDIGFAPARHWLLYLPVMVLAITLAIPFIIVAEKKHKLKQVLLGAIAALALAMLGMGVLGESLGAMALWLLLFFTAFNLLEATLPSLVSKFAPADARGTAMGVYSSSQFIGAFIGGTVGGGLHGLYGLYSVFLFAAAALGLWWLAALGMRQPRYLASHLLKVGTMAPSQAAMLSGELMAVRGVAEAVVNGEEGVAYLKVDSQQLDRTALERYSLPES